MKNNKRIFQFNTSVEIGSPDAETDNLLMRAFVENEALKSLLSIENQKCIIIGRTGSGKSALLKYLESTQEKVCRLEPEVMSLRFLSNSTILTYFRTLGINLNFFYKVLWKHVFMVELLKLHFGDDVFKKTTWLQALTEKLAGSSGKNNPRIEKAIAYITRWSKDFWINTEVRIKEIEKNVEEKFLVETGLKFSDLFNLASEESNKERTVIEYKSKAETIINESQVEELHEVIRIMKDEIFVNGSKRYYVIIDDLDKEWIPTEIRYDLISAMLEVLKEFKVMTGVKIVIALRDNLYQLILSGIKHKGGQREKFKPLYLRLEWTPEKLRELVEKRLEIVTENSVSVKDAFERVHKGTTGFEYVLERTFLRPRDVISFVNHAIENANNKQYFTLDIIKKAEISYSIDRLTAIEDEWGENYGQLKDIYGFLIGRYNGFKIRNLKEDDFAGIYFNDKPEKIYNGDLLDVILKWRSDKLTFHQFVKEIIFILYQIGIVGLKISANHPINFFYYKDLVLTQSDIGNDTKIYVHKSFYSALKINTKELEENVY